MKPPYDYDASREQARERVAKTNKAYKSKTTKKQRLAIGIVVAFAATLLIAGVVHSCGS